MYSSLQNAYEAKYYDKDTIETFITRTSFEELFYQDSAY